MFLIESLGLNNSFPSRLWSEKLEKYLNGMKSCFRYFFMFFEESL